MQWVYVSDLVNGLVLGGTAAAARNQIFNIAGGESTGLGRVIEIIAEILAGHQREAWSWAGLHRMVPSEELKWSIRKAIDILGYTPQVTLGDGLARVLQSLRTTAPDFRGNRPDLTIGLPVRRATNAS
jgi:nucleoside-diphosphate-sugar epimerase